MRPETLPPPTETPPQRVLRQFRIVFNAVKTHFRQVERDTGVGGAQLWALSVIERQPGIGATSLARELDIHQSTASNLVRSLVERGFVAASRESTDRRLEQDLDTLIDQLDTDDVGKIPLAQL